MAHELVAVADLPASGVTIVNGTPHGTLAVGLSDGVPFAVSNRCRHLGAPLGKGHVAEDGCLECPWHGARFETSTGRMLKGPGGVFRPLGGAVKATMGRMKLSTYPVTLEGGVISLADA